jgi:heme-degrading monooxygenase HmoA
MTEIIANDKVFTLINTFTVLPSNQQKIIDLLIDITERVTIHMPGFLSATVHRSQDGHHVANYVQWKTAGNFADVFESEEMQKHMLELRTYATEILPVSYVIAYTKNRPLKADHAQ